MRKLIFAILFFASTASASTTYIGNGGDAFNVPGKGLVLTDFLSQELETPWIGDEIDPVLQKMFDQNTNLLSVFMTKETKNAYLRKLTDIQKMSPRMGEYLLSVSLLQLWWPYAGPIENLPGDRSQDWAPPQPWERKQLAVRHQLYVYWDFGLWATMSVENRVGLLIHETVSALTVPQCEERSRVGCLKYRQPQEKIRATVAGFFTREQPDRALLLQSLAIPFANRYPEYGMALAPHYETVLRVYCAPNYEQFAFEILPRKNIGVPPLSREYLKCQ